MVTTTIVTDIATCKGKIIVSLEIQAPNVKKRMTVALDALKMGIDTKGDFEMTLTKDLMRIVENYYAQFNHLPTFDTVRKETEKNFYGMGKYGSKFSETMLNNIYGEYGVENMVNRINFLLNKNIFKREYIKSLFTTRNLKEFDRLAKIYKLPDAPTKLRQLLIAI